MNPSLLAQLLCPLLLIVVGHSFSLNHITPSFGRDEIFEQSAFRRQGGKWAPAPFAVYGDNNEGVQEPNEDEAATESLTNLGIEEEERQRKKNQIAKAQIALRLQKAGTKLETTTDEEEEKTLLDKLNPFTAGQSVRESLNSAISSLARASSSPGALSEDQQRSLYYLDDRFKESGGALFTPESNPYLTQLEKDDYVPEVLVVGAKGEVGRLVVKRLLLEGRSRVRVLVPDLYSRTLNMLGTGVVYYQGDLHNMESLETALTDVDKIVHINSAPRPDEDAFQQKFKEFANDNLRGSAELDKIKLSLNTQDSLDETVAAATDLEWERLESVLKIRASLAREIDYVGMLNLVRAYQNVRFADYGTSQAAKRSLFKFQSRAEDYNLFTIDDDSETVDTQAKPLVYEDNDGRNAASSMDTSTNMASTKSQQSGDMHDEYADEYEKYAEVYEDYEDTFDDKEGNAGRALSEQRLGNTVKSQVQWIRNEFGHGVFVGKVPRSTSGGVGGEASIISSRLRSRDGGPEDGIDLGGGFGGLLCRVCADGGVYEALVRDASYERCGIEFVSEFSTASKAPQKGNASRNKFVTVRLPFESFKPVKRRAGDIGDGMGEFVGKDVRHLGFRYRSARNPKLSQSRRKDEKMDSFYFALSYIKLYRVQPEPEFVYLSDASIPPVVMNSQVRHDLHQLLPAESFASSGASNVGAFQILDEPALQQMASDKTARSSEETYYKFRGEEVLKGSGLSYAIIRVAGYNEATGSETSTIDLKSTDDDIKLVSRAEVAQVCVSALLDPNALNKSFYISKKEKGGVIDESMTEKFSNLR